MFLALVAVAVQNPLTAGDFFPMQPGTVWTYESSGDQSGIYDQAIGQAANIGGKTIHPVLTVNNGKILMKTFYEATPSGLYILGQDPEKPFAKPQPVFQFDPKGAKWEFEGASPYESDTQAGMRMTGSSKLVGERDVLGEKRLCLEVKSDTKIGLTSESATTFKQTMVFAKDVGMVSLEQSAQLGRRTTKFKVKLIKFEKAGAFE